MLPYKCNYHTKNYQSSLLTFHIRLVCALRLFHHTKNYQCSLLRLHADQAGSDMTFIAQDLKDASTSPTAVQKLFVSGIAERDQLFLTRNLSPASSVAPHVQGIKRFYYA